MYESLLELVPAFVEVGLLSGATLLLSTLGVYLERLGLASIGAGELGVGLWLIALGSAALYFGPYLLGYTELRPRVRSLATVSDGD